MGAGGGLGGRPRRACSTTRAPALPDLGSPSHTSWVDPAPAGSRSSRSEGTPAAAPGFRLGVAAGGPRFGFPRRTPARRQPPAPGPSSRDSMACSALSAGTDQARAAYEERRSRSRSRSMESGWAARSRSGTAVTKLTIVLGPRCAQVRSVDGEGSFGPGRTMGTLVATTLDSDRAVTVRTRAPGGRRVSGAIEHKVRQRGLPLAGPRPRERVGRAGARWARGSERADGETDSAIFAGRAGATPAWTAHGLVRPPSSEGNRMARRQAQGGPR